MKISKAVIIGDGDMTVEIAALLANWEILSLLMTSDIKISEGMRRHLIRMPQALFEANRQMYLQAGALSTHHELLARADIVFDCTGDDPQDKQKLFELIAAKSPKTSLVISCSTTMTLTELRKTAGEKLSPRVVKAHFALPTRMHACVEIASDGRNTDALHAFSDFVQRRLGRVPLICRDAAGSLMERLEAQFLRNLVTILSRGLATLEELEFLAGPVLGFPASGGLSKIDAMGAESFANILDHFQKLYPDEADVWTRPSLLDNLMAKAKEDPQLAKFYLRGGPDVNCFRSDRLTHTPFQQPDLSSIEAHLETQSFAVRLRGLLNAEGRWSDLVWRVIKPIITYSMRTYPKLFNSTADFDLAIREGLSYQFGPFELWDMIGFDAVVERLNKDGISLPPYLDDLNKSESKSFFKFVEGGHAKTIDASGKQVDVARPPVSFHILKQFSSAVEHTADGSLYDIGDGIFAFEIHSPKQLVTYGLCESFKAALGMVVRNGIGMVIGTEGKNFSPGGDFHTAFGLAKQKKYEDLQKFIRARQSLGLMLKYSPVPIVTAVRGFCGGGGLEIALQTSQIHGEPNLMMGFNETSFGMIPMGGGLKELTMRASQDKEKIEEIEAELIKRYEHLVTGAMSSSFFHAQKLGLIKSTDTLSRSTSNQMLLAKSETLRHYTFGYSPPPENPMFSVPGKSILGTFENLVLMWEQSGQMQGPQAQVARAVARVLAGGEVSPGAKVSETTMLDLELESAMSLLTSPDHQNILERALRGGVI